MKTTVLCTDVRPATQSGTLCVVVASLDERQGVRETDMSDASNLSEVRDRLRDQGITLGGPLQDDPSSGTRSGVASPVEIIAHDEQGGEHRFVAEALEEYSLSSGSTLYFLYVRDAPSECNWLVGRALELMPLRIDGASTAACADSPLAGVQGERIGK